MWHLDRRSTDERRKAIDSYFRGLESDTGLQAGMETSSSDKECLHGALVSPHVGNAFDLKWCEKSHRLLIVGRDAYYEDPVRIEERRRHFLNNTKEERRKRLNPHIRGTEQILRVFLGLPLGREPEDTKITVSGEVTNIYDCFAATNFFPKSRVAKTNKTSSKATKEMRPAGQRILEETVRVLEPTVVIFQGVRLLDYFLYEPVKIDNAIALQAFSHPSYRRNPWGWGSGGYFKTVVLPHLVRHANPTGREYPLYPQLS